jgi:hypothetical protein
MTAFLKLLADSIVAFPAGPGVEAGNFYRVQVGGA